MWLVISIGSLIRESCLNTWFSTKGPSLPSACRSTQPAVYGRLVFSRATLYVFVQSKADSSFRYVFWNTSSTASQGNHLNTGEARNMALVRTYNRLGMNAAVNK